MVTESWESANGYALGLGAPGAGVACRNPEYQ